MKKMIMGLLSGLLCLCLCGALAAAPDAAEGKLNAEQFRRFIEEGWNQGKEDVFREVIAPDCMFYINGELTPAIGPEAMIQALKKNQEDYPNFKMTIEDIFSSEDKVTCRYVIDGVFIKMKRPIKQYSAIIAQFAGGKIVKSWTYDNTLNLYKQLGFKLTPPPNVKFKDDKSTAAASSTEQEGSENSREEIKK